MAPEHNPRRTPVVVGSDLYDHLEKVMDRFEDVANQISSIVVEHV